MTKTLDALYDGKAFLPEEPLDLQPNTRVRITVETDPAPQAEPYSFLDMAQTLRLEGPPDWSERIEDYLRDG
ncbi:MAG: antitoxin family protein [Thermoanaerobaculia bacterium]